MKERSTGDCHDSYSEILPRRDGRTAALTDDDEAGAPLPQTLGPACRCASITRERGRALPLRPASRLRDDGCLPVGREHATIKKDSLKSLYEGGSSGKIVRAYVSSQVGASSYGALACSLFTAMISSSALHSRRRFSAPREFGDSRLPSRYIGSCA